MLKSPSGEIVKGWGLSKFAREHNLDNTLLGKVVNGEVWQHKGWTRPDKTMLDFLNWAHGSLSFRSPEGSIVNTRNLREFCKCEGLNYKSMVAVANGRKEQYKGWTLSQENRGKSL